MPLSVPLIFHFNQHITEFAHVASHVCYRGLLRVLRQHPDLPVNISISGTLIHALQWLDPEPLELIRAGLEAGQFELLGSTYASNVMYASDDWDNARQIELHRRVLWDTFGVEPVAFWNPGRCWRQSLASVIARAGYRVTLIEDHILDAAGQRDAVVVSTEYDGRRIMVVRDDVALHHRLNFATLFGRLEQLQRYVREAATVSGASVHWRACAENADAGGLWSWQQEVVPHTAWRNLDQVLSRLREDGVVEFVHLSNVPGPEATLASIADGSAERMDAAFADADSAWHEEGYKNWFHFNETAPDLLRMRRMYARLRQRLKEPDDASSPGARAIRSIGLHTYLAHQHNFGSTGFGWGGYRGWEGARAALACIRAADFARQPARSLSVEDVTGEGYDEVLLCDGRDLLVLAPGGGRLLYWFDLVAGRQFVGNQLSVFDDEYAGDAVFPVRETLWKPWLPDTWDPEAAIPEVTVVAEAPPTRMGPYLPAWLWDGAANPVTLETRDTEFWVEIDALIAQRRALADHIAVDGGDLYDPDEDLDYRFEGDEVVFIRYLEPDITLEKRYRLDDGAARVTYVFRNRDVADHLIGLHITNELCPDYDAVIRGGRAALAYIATESARGVRNTVSGDVVQFTADRAWSDATQQDALLALEVGATFTLKVAAGGAAELKIALTRSDGE
ncbi:MAG: hypothetical protein ACE5FI_07400 [Anaerolineales bacterium]